MTKSYNVKPFAFDLITVFHRQIKNSCSGYSRTISDFQAVKVFVWKVRGAPGQKIRVSFAGRPGRIRGRNVTKSHPYYIITPPL